MAVGSVITDARSWRWGLGFAGGPLFGGLPLRQYAACADRRCRDPASRPGTCAFRMSSCGALGYQGSTGELCAAMPRSEEHTSELQSLMRISYAVFCLKKKNQQ